MDKSINGCFEDIGMRLYNRRWSWGAQNDNLIVLRAKKTNIPLVTRGKSSCHRRRPQEFNLFASSSRTARQDAIAQSATSVRGSPIPTGLLKRLLQIPPFADFILRWLRGHLEKSPNGCAKCLRSSSSTIPVASRQVLCNLIEFRQGRPA